MGGWGERKGEEGSEGGKEGEKEEGKCSSSFECIA